VRVASTNVRSTGLKATRIRVANATVPVYPTSSYTDQPQENTIASVDNTYTDVLPSLNGTLQMMQGKLLLRGGLSKVMSRPRLDLLAPNITCTIDSGSANFVTGGTPGDGTDNCTGGNPDLKPYRATKFDTSLEFYPSRDTQLSLGLFRTQIKTYVRTGITTTGVDFFGDGKLWDVTQPVNGEGAMTRGLELAGRTALTFLPGWMSGFGVDANYTRMGFSYASGQELISAMDGSTLPYPGLSKYSYNLGLWYDQGMVNARVAYHHRSKFYTGGNDVTGNPNFRDASGYLDAKLQLRLNKNFTVSMEAKNLTDQAELSYAGELSRPNELAWSGRRYYLTLGYKL
jgi:TonB-dependent receptor